MEPSFDSWTIVFLIAAFQGVFLSIVIFKKGSLANRYLSALILGFSLCLIYYVLFWTGYARVLSPLLGLLQGLTYAFGPLALGYVVASKNQSAISRWHFIAFGCYVAYFLGWNLYPKTLLPEITTIQSIIQNVHLVAYTMLIFRAQGKEQTLTNGELKKHKWLKSIALAFLGYSVSFVSYFILVWTGTIEIIYDYSISVASSVFIYYIGYMGFQRPELLLQRKKYEKSSLTQSVAKAILKQMRTLMLEEKLFLDSSLNLQSFATKLGYPTHYISQALNDLEKKNFPDFVNEYRVMEACDLIKRRQDLQMIQIAYQSGFNNKASFNNAFKRFVGVPPSKFKERQSTWA